MTFELAEDVKGIKNPFKEHQEKFDALFVEEDFDDTDQMFGDFIDKIFEANTKLFYKDFQIAAPTKVPWFFEADDLRKKVFEKL